jgi:hypothetical protein
MGGIYVTCPRCKGIGHYIDSPIVTPIDEVKVVKSESALPVSGEIHQVSMSERDDKPLTTMDDASNKPITSDDLLAKPKKRTGRPKGWKKYNADYKSVLV